MRGGRARGFRADFVLPGVLAAVALGMALLATPRPARAAFGPPPLRNAAEIQVALDKVATTGTVLYIAAHPDDENTAFLAWLESQRHVRAAYLSMTRGDGGQNLIGDEKGDLLGVIRTQELLAARRVDNAEQFFTRAVDFGFSKNPEETLKIWGHDSTLADVVRVIRTLRPDIIVTRFPTTGEGGHGHHTASAILAGEALAAAADPKRFPEQIAQGLSPWQARRLFWNYFTWTKPPTPEEQAAKKLVSADLGAWNPLLGRAANEVAAESRSMHKSQGFGSAERRGAQLNYFQQLAGDPAEGDLLSGIDLTWKRLPGGAQLASILETARANYDPRDPAASLSLLLGALDELKRIGQSPAGKLEHELIDSRTRELTEIIRSCAGLWFEGISTRPSLIPGDSLVVNAMLVNRTRVPITLEWMRMSHVDHAGRALPAGDWMRQSVALTENAPQTITLKALVDEDADWHLAEPYWLRRPASPGLFRVDDPGLVGRAENPPIYMVNCRLTVAGRPLELSTPVLYRWTDRVRGELYRPVVTAPEATLSLDEKVYLFPDATPRPVRLTIASRDARGGTARLAAPAGWKVQPAEAAVTLPGKDQPAEVVFQVTPPKSNATGALAASFTTDGHTLDQSLVTIDYPHIPLQTVYLPASARALRLGLERRGDNLGYVMGPGDEVPAALRQAGYRVTLLTDADLDAANLSAYDAIVIGVRAYNTRERLKLRNARLLDYVKGGGTVVVQYQTNDDTLYKDFAAAPLTLGRDRVTVEDAPVTFPDPNDPILNSPNKLGPEDFEGWVQERGTYFGSTWDPAYRTPLESHDPGEPERKGGLLVAPVGKGTFIYSGYAFFRQLPAGVPGAYRLFLNILAAGARPNP